MQGFMEMGETGEEAAAREAREELNADVQVGGLLGVYSLPHIGQIQLIYTSTMRNVEDVNGTSVGGTVSAGQETDKVGLFRWEEIPWDALAFPTTSWALWHHHESLHDHRKQLSRQTSSSLPSEQVDSETGVFEGHTRCGDKRDVDGADTSMPHQSREGGDLRRLPLGGAVYSTPTTNRALFWCPTRGLHLKNDWKLATDS